MTVAMRKVTSAESANEKLLLFQEAENVLWIRPMVLILYPRTHGELCRNEMKKHASVSHTTQRPGKIWSRLTPLLPQTAFRSVYTLTGLEVRVAHPSARRKLT